MASQNPFKKNPSTKFKNIDDVRKEEAKEEVENLREAIEYHNYRYYIKNDPEISDRAYDKLFKRLQELENAFPALQSDTSPTRRIGAEPVDELKKVEHTAPMLSLNSALNEEEIKNFDDFVRRNSGKKEIVYVLEPKLDGLSVEVVYENGVFRYGATRGNGEIGEDISENLKTIRSLPLKLRANGNAPSRLAVRGEVIMSRQGFRELNKKRIEGGEDPFANPRNAAAGIVRQLDSKKVADKPLDIYFYEILQSGEEGYKSHWELLNQFPKWGFKTNPSNKKSTSLKEIKRYWEELSGQREELDYEIDGIVIKLNDREAREGLGTRERSPRWAIAWKFPPRKEITTLNDIVVQVGRTGMLTPVALLEPVEVGGVTVSRASLHNEAEARKKDVRPGDKVRIMRAGDVIPEVVERTDKKNKKRGSKFSMPKNCPVCGTEIVKEGAYYFCPAGLSCQAQLVGRVIHYVSRNAMDINNLGEKIVRQLVEKEMVRDLADLYNLTKADFLKLEGFAEKSAQQLYNAIQAAKKPQLNRFLYALGIRHVGQHIARVLAETFRSLKALQKAKLKELKQINEIGPEIVESVNTFFNTKENRKTIERLMEAGVEIQEMPSRNGNLPLKDKTLVFTGELENYTRDEAEELVESLGGRASSSVSSNTDYLIVGKNPGSKLDKAEKENVNILNEEEFDELIKLK